MPTMGSNNIPSPMSTLEQMCGVSLRSARDLCAGSRFLFQRTTQCLCCVAGESMSHLFSAAKGNQQKRKTEATETKFQINQTKLMLAEICPDIGAMFTMRLVRLQRNDLCATLVYQSFFATRLLISDVSSAIIHRTLLPASLDPRRTSSEHVCLQRQTETPSHRCGRYRAESQVTTQPRRIKQRSNQPRPPSIDRWMTTNCASSALARIVAPSSPKLLPFKLNVLKRVKNGSASAKSAMCSADQPTLSNLSFSRKTEFVSVQQCLGAVER